MQARYSLIPQMKEYDKIGHEWLPYLMYFHSPNYISSVVNTDSRGFRITHKGSRKISDFKGIDNQPVGLLAGGSLVFGVGATDDTKTIASMLNSHTDYLWLNFGGRAFNSTQELILFLVYHRHIKNIRKIVLLSGLNNLILHFFTGGSLNELGPFFFSAKYHNAMRSEAALFGRRLQGFLEPKKKKEEISPLKTKNYLLDILNRDIANWKIFCEGKGIELLYALQPLANWVNKKLSGEEEALFAYLDSLPQNHFRVLKDKLNTDIYIWLLQGLSDICKAQGIRFADMNECLSGAGRNGEWLFVDRAHLNDTGNRYVMQALIDKFNLR